MNNNLLGAALAAAGFLLAGSAASQELSNLGGPLGPVYYDLHHQAFLFDVDAYDAVGSCRGSWSGLVSMKGDAQEALYPYCAEGAESEISEPNPRHSIYSLNSTPMKQLAAASAHNGPGSGMRPLDMAVVLADALQAEKDFIRLTPGACDPMDESEARKLVGGACYRAPNGDELVRGKVGGGIWEGGPTWSTEAYVHSHDFLESRHWNNRAFASYKAGNYAKAIEGFEKSKAFDPKNTNAVINVASVYALMGHRERALKNLRSAFQMDPALTRKRILSDKDFESILLDPAVLDLLHEDTVLQPPGYSMGISLVTGPTSVFYDARKASFIFLANGKAPCEQGYLSIKDGSAETIFPDCIAGVERQDTNHANRLYPPDSVLMKRLGEILATGQQTPADQQSVMYEAIDKALAQQPDMQRLEFSACDSAIEIEVESRRDPLTRLWQGACYVSASGDTLFIGTEVGPQYPYDAELGDIFYYFSKDILASRHANSQAIEIYKSGRVEDAIKLFEHAKDLDPRYFDAVLNLATLDAHAGRAPEAVANLLAANDLNPSETRRQVLSRDEFHAVLSSPELRKILLTHNAAALAGGSQLAAAPTADAFKPAMIVSADTACALSVDDEKVADLVADSPATFHVDPGTYVIACVSPNAPDAAFRGVQTINAGQELSFRVELAKRVRIAVAEHGEAEATRREEAAISAERAAIRAAQEMKDAGGGLLLDPRTGLLWTKTDSGVGLKWTNAKEFCQKKSMQLPGTDQLRMLREHLFEHCDASGCEPFAQFKLLSNDVWTRDLLKPDSARVFSFYGAERDFGIDWDTTVITAICVRGP